MLLLGLTLGLIGGFLYSKSQYAKQLEQQLQLIKSEMFSASERILKERVPGVTAVVPAEEELI